MFSSPNATRVNEQFVNGTTCQTTMAYICKQEYYDTLIANYREGLEKLAAGGHYTQFALDIYWKSLQSSGWVFAYPPLGRQKPGFSDIEKKDVDYSWSHLPKLTE